MQGARYLLFESSIADGHATCVFERPNADMVSVSPAAAPPEQQSNHIRKADAENPLLDHLGTLVAEWTQSCLEKESDKDYAAAGACWREAAKSVNDTLAGAALFKTPQLEEKAEQLQSAWIMRAEQLKPYLAEPAKPSAAVEPASLKEAVSENVEDSEADQAPIRRASVERSAPAGRYDGPDPRRLAETTVCSSTNLGDAKSCVLDPVAVGEGGYAFKIRSRCSSGVIAAIKTYDAQGRCIRRVVSIAPRTRSDVVESYQEPAVLDAIRDRGQETLECYFRRHDNVSCSGKIDYDATSPRQQVAEVRSEEMPLSPAPRKKRKRAIPMSETPEPAEAKPSLFRRVSKGIKNLLGKN
jgi:hypothetical protein